MGCLLVLISLGAPRLVIFALAISTNWLSRAYETTIWPLLGWLLMPYTTLAYMVAKLNCPGQISNGYIVLIVIAVMIDLSSTGNAANQAKD